MKIAALYDIHGNLPALNALLAEIEEVQPDLIVIGGDIVSGPMPGQPWSASYSLENVLTLFAGMETARLSRPLMVSPLPLRCQMRDAQ
ncbi:metallophosphoesterase [Ktedonospora formicarum]|uniref:metallophosphoesterase family protein n=1 Tax=Ktedonospora formicarum TaxID=2778364 RepID=UPI001C690FB7